MSDETSRREVTKSDDPAYMFNEIINILKRIESKLSLLIKPFISNFTFQYLFIATF